MNKHFHVRKWPIHEQLRLFKLIIAWRWLNRENTFIKIVSISKNLNNEKK